MHEPTYCSLGPRATLDLSCDCLVAIRAISKGLGSPMRDRSRSSPNKAAPPMLDSTCNERFRGEICGRVLLTPSGYKRLFNPSQKTSL